MALACKIMYFEGMREELGFEFAGHISIRIAANRFLMPGHLHHKFRGLFDLTPKDVIQVDLNGSVVAGNLEPVDEVVIHTGIYKARQEINSIVHMHPPAATALASTDQSIIPISIKSSFFYGRVRVLERGPRLIDNEEIANELVEKLGKYSVVIHKGHGIVTAGKSLEEACLLAIFLENTARNQILAKQLGNLIPFEKGAISDFGNKMKLADHPEWWEYYEKKWRNTRF
ncbi:MAG: class II aldolase/adducin family protein [Thaumarchaeota archaeon]|nr:class II aldolase/adducin family protein [Nitrososphaerota archaeon]